MRSQTAACANTSHHRQSRILLLLLVLLTIPSAYAANCSPASGLRAEQTLDILPADQIATPWSNETPKQLRSSSVVDGRVSLRIDMRDWSPFAFDDNGAINSSDYDFLELKLRTNISMPPINVISSTGVVCPLEHFILLQQNSWMHLQIPLASLGYKENDSIRRIKFKSKTASAYTLWVTEVRLAGESQESESPGTAPPDTEQPEPEQPDPPPTPVDSTPEEETVQLVSWDTDPGVKQQIDNHLPAMVLQLEANGNDQIDDSAAFLSAIEAVRSGGIVQIPEGTFYLSVPLMLTQDRQVLRGSGADKTRLIFTESQRMGIGITGQYPQRSVPIMLATYLSKEVRVAKTTVFTPGSYATITDTISPARQVVSIVGQTQHNGYTLLTLEEPLNSSFAPSARMQVFDANEYSGVESLSLDVASSTVLIGDMFFLRSAANVWVRDVKSYRARESHVFTRQTYHCEISGSTFDDSTGHGDGKQGYGVDLANSTTGCLIENNVLKHLRHSLILNAGSSGNIVAFNVSSSPRHPNFANGGPGDISFHHYAYANLVEGNVVERIHIGDANAVGRGNMIHRNCVTSGPLTIHNSPGATQYLLNNAIYGSDQTLQVTVMPPVLPQLTTARPYLQTGGTLFDEDGIDIGPIAAEPVAMNNWHAGVIWNPTSDQRDSYYNADFTPLLASIPTGDWRIDCNFE